MFRMVFIGFFCLHLAVLAQGPEKPPPPNVILIMVDDLGYHDLGSYGHPSIRTPHLDRLAREGVRFTDFYSGATVCTPSRMALLTGYYPNRLGWERGVVGHLMPKGTGLSPSVTTLAEVFKEAGYETALIGKWHLGDAASFRPHQQGFQHTYYLNKSNNQTRKVWRGDEVVEDPFDNRLLTEQFFSEAEAFIHQQTDAPFLLYLPLTAPHFPVEAHPDFDGRSPFGVYGDVVEEVDERIGSLLEQIEKQLPQQKTLVWFLSDNGPEPGEAAQAKPFRGLKWDALEAGTRVPSILWWPGQVPAGRICHGLTGALDIMPTLLAACGLNLPAPIEGLPPLDGQSQWGMIQDPALHGGRESLLYWHGREGFQAIRMGRWKLFPVGSHASLEEGGPDGQKPALFDLEQDPGERINLAAKYPQRVEHMLQVSQAKLADIQAHRIPLGQAP